ncbi:sulfatase-like hydrolase/transferase [bacterium]|nr:sulfatase-like hydrolase/transferase [FCB group bacterium]MBL7190814.1 sulfatase-like hydrolase/transferase [bacterium]
MRIRERKQNKSFWIWLWLGSALTAAWMDSVNVFKDSGVWNISGFFLLILTAFLLYAVLFLSGVILYFTVKRVFFSKKEFNRTVLASVCIIGMGLFIYFTPMIQAGLLSKTSVLSPVGLLASLVSLILSGAAAFILSLLWRRGNITAKFTAYFLIIILIGTASGIIHHKNRRNLGAQPAAPAGAYNILLITIDTLNTLYLSCYGNPYPGTPNIDKLSEMGVQFDRMFCTLPRTGPSFSSMMTGAYPAALGLNENFQPLSEEVSTLAELLYKQGYTTGAIVNNPVLLAALSGLDQGFEDYDDNVTASVYPFNDLARLNVIHLLSFVELPDWVFYSNIRSARKVTETACEWINNTDKPFFYWLHYQDPHTPYFPPEEYREKYAPKPEGIFDPNSVLDGYLMINRGEVDLTDNLREYMQSLYRAEVAFVDEQIGKIIRFLESNNLFENTIVIFIGDHGENIMHHHDYIGHGKYIYEEELRVPFIMITPDIQRRGVKLSELTEVLDIFPAILDYCGMDIIAQSQGQSLKPLLEGMPYDTSAWRQSVYCETAPMHRREPGKQRFGVRSGEWKLFNSAFQSEVELYNLLSDPAERHNLAQRETTVVEELLSILEDKKLLMKPIVKVSHGEFTGAQKQQLKALGYAH